MTTIDKRILVADDINRMSYELGELYDHFGGNNVDAVGTLESLNGIFPENRYRVTIIDPLVFTKRLPELRELVGLVKAHSDRVVYVNSGFLPRDLGLRMDVDYDLEIGKPYDRTFIPQIKRLMKE